MTYLEYLRGLGLTPAQLQEAEGLVKEGEALTKRLRRFDKQWIAAAENDIAELKARGRKMERLSDE